MLLTKLHMFFQVSSMPGGEQQAAGMLRVWAGEVLLQGLPEEALGEQAQARMQRIGINEALGDVSAENFTLHIDNRLT